MYDYSLDWTVLPVPKIAGPLLVLVDLICRKIETFKFICWSWFIQWIFLNTHHFRVKFMSFISTFPFLLFHSYLVIPSSQVHSKDPCCPHTAIKRKVISWIKYDRSFLLYRYIPCAMRTNPKWRGKANKNLTICNDVYD